MKNSMKCLLLAGLTVMSTLLATACASDGGAAGSDTTASGVNAETTTAAEAVTTDRPPLAVESEDYGGYEFNTLSYKRGATGTYHQYLDFSWSDEMAGETINDAIYARNLKVEEDFNITIKNNESDISQTSIRTLVQSGDTMYDVMQPHINDIVKLGQESLFVNMFDVPGMDITNPWWDAAMIRDLAICDKMYAITGDISMADEELNYAVFINKALVETYNLGDCYRHVRDDEWNLDKMLEYAAIVTHDLNGDGLMDENDVYGILTDYSTAAVWFFSFGGQMATINDDGKPELVLMNERNTNMLERLNEVFNDKSVLVNASSLPGTWTDLDTLLMEDRGLFRVGSVYDIQGYRSMVNDFGILPYPKLDETQDEYYHLIATNVCMGISIPTTNTKLEQTGIILEALSYYSRDTITKAYYDVNLYTKVARDEESGEMLDIIFATKRYDIANVLDWGGFRGMLTSAVQPNGNFSSLYAAAESKAQAALEETYEKFSE